MSLAADRPEFAPPPQRGTTRAVILALIAHVLLIAALTWGVHWKREAEDDAVEAELWSSTVQQAAPRLSAPPTPVTPPTPAPAPTPAPPPPPPPSPPAPQVRPDPTPAPRAPDIALEREKKLKEQKEREREQEEDRQDKLKAQQQQQAAKKAQEKKDLEAKQRAEDEAERKQEQQQKLAEAKKKQEADAKKADAQKAADAKKADAQKAAAAEAKQADASKQAAEKSRQDNIRRMLGQAGSTGEQTSAPKSGKGSGAGGPSAGYYGRVAALIRRNVVFPDAELLAGNPAAEIEIKTSPDGTIVGTPRLVKSSGNAAWDEAALRAIQRTEVMPRDVDGQVPSPFPPIVLRPKVQ